MKKSFFITALILTSLLYCQTCACAEGIAIPSPEPVYKGASFYDLIDMAKDAIRTGSRDVAKEAMSRALAASKKLKKVHVVHPHGHFVSLAVEAAKKNDPVLVKKAISCAKKAPFSEISFGSTWGEDELISFGYINEYLVIILIRLQHVREQIDAWGMAEDLMQKGFKDEASLAYRRALDFGCHGEFDPCFPCQELAEKMAKDGFKNEAIKAYKKTMSCIIKNKFFYRFPDFLPKRVKELTQSIEGSGLEGEIKLPRKLENALAK